MFNILAQPQCLSCEAELLFDGFVGCDDTSGIVRSVEIPGVKTREVLEGTEELITTDLRFLLAMAMR